MISADAPRSASPARSASRPAGCARVRASRRPRRDPRDYAARVGCACGGPDKVRLDPRRRGPALRVLRRALSRCTRRRATWTSSRGRRVGEVTQYADHEFHERLHVTDAPPVLSARVKADMMRRMLRPRPGRDACSTSAAARASSRSTRPQGGRARGGRRRGAVLPAAGRARGRPRARRPAPAAVPQGQLSRAPTSLDVLEHLDEPRRARGPARGAPHARARAAGSSSTRTPWSRRGSPRFQRGVNRLARRLGQARPHRPRARGDAQERPPQRRSAATSTSTSCAPRPGSRWRSAATTTSSSRRWSRTCGLRLFEQWRRRGAKTPRPRRAPAQLTQPAPERGAIGRRTTARAARCWPSRTASPGSSSSTWCSSAASAPGRSSACSCRASGA